MQIIRQKSTAPSPYLVMYAGADLTAGEIAALGVGWCDPRVSTTLAEVVSGVTLPAGFLPDSWTYNGAAWAVVTGKQPQVDVRLGMPSITVPTIGSATAGAVLTTEGVLSSYVDLTWAAVSTATSYEIRYALTTDANWSIWTVQDSRSASNTYRLGGLIAGKAYKFGIRANCLWGLSGWSADFNVTAAIPSTPPGDVLGFAGSFANNLVSLSWTLLDALNLHTYEIRSGGSGVTWSAATAIRTGEKSGKWSFRPASAGPTTYLIKARDLVGNYSAAAASVSVTVPIAAPPTALTTAGVLFGIEITVTYPTTLDIDYCEIWAATTNDRATAIMVGITRDGKFLHNGLGNAATRYYWARTKNVFGENSTWYPVSSTAGVLGATVANPSDVIKLLNSQVDTSILAAYIAGTGSFSDVLDTFTPAALAGVGGAGVFATKGQMLIAADKSIQLMAGSADVNASISILDTAIGLKLNQTGTVGAGLLISAPVGGKSSVQVWADAFQFCQPDGSGVKPVFTIGTIGGDSTFGFSGDMVLDGSLTARTIGADIFIGKTYVMGDATNDGVLETHNYSSAATGIRITGGASPAITVKGGTITGSQFTLAGGGVMRMGKSSYADTASGLWLGDDGGTPKFNFGNSTAGIKWDGAALTISGDTVTVPTVITLPTFSRTAAQGGADTTWLDTTLTVNASVVLRAHLLMFSGRGTSGLAIATIKIYNPSSVLVASAQIALEALTASRSGESILGTLNAIQGSVSMAFTPVVAGAYRVLVTAISSSQITTNVTDGSVIVQASTR